MAMTRAVAKHTAKAKAAARLAGVENSGEEEEVHIAIPL